MGRDFGKSMDDESESRNRTLKNKNYDNSNIKPTETNTWFLDLCQFTNLDRFPEPATKVDQEYSAISKGENKSDEKGICMNKI